MRAKRLNYTVNTGGQWINKGDNSTQNFREFKSFHAALRYMRANPSRGQVDVRGWDERGNFIKACCAYWEKGKVVMQAF